MSHHDHALATDPTWNDRFAALPFSKIASNEWYAAQKDESEQRAAAKAEFLANDELRAPRIIYSKLRNEHVFDEAERTYQTLLNDASTDAEYEKAARRLAELYRHKEVIRGLGRTGLRKVLSQERAGNMSAEIFGEPDRDTFLNLLGKLRAKAQAVASDLPAATELLTPLGDATPEHLVRNPELSVETLQALHDDLRTLFPGLDDVIEFEGEDSEAVTPETTRWYIERQLDFFGLTEKGWTFEIIPGSTAAASTDSNRKVITIGEKRPDFTKGQLKKTGIHEVLGHAYRASGDVSLASLVFEEGFAVVLEQIVTETPREGSGEQYYTSLGLQFGLDRDGDQRDFRDTFEIMWRRYIVLAAANGKPITKETAMDKAYGQVYRTRRGDAIDTRDISYFEGARVAPEWVNTIAELPVAERRRALVWVLSGRFDPTNDQHVEQHPIVGQ